MPTEAMSPMTSPQPETDNHAVIAAFEEIRLMADMLSGDVVLVPNASHLDGVTRNDLVKLSHWSSVGDDGKPLLDQSSAMRLAVLTDSFFRFIDEGDDASFVTLRRGGTPLVQQVDGKLCQAAADLIMDSITNGEAMREKWVGLEPLESEIEMVAYEHRMPGGNRPKWLEREARRRLEARDIGRKAHAEPKSAPVAANNNEPADAKLRRLFEGGVVKYNGDIRRHYIDGCQQDGKVGVGVLNDDGEPVFEAFAQQPREPIKATPFALVDPASLPQRDWLFGRHFIRRYLTATVGAGGSGKSAHAVSEVLAMVTGRPLLDPDGPLTTPIRAWYVNAEDPQDEIDRRFHAAAKHFRVTADQIGDRLYTDSGRDQEFVIMRQEGRDLRVCQPLIDELVAEIQRREIDVVVIDPFVSTHEVAENDNGAMQRVAKAWTEVADRANCGVEVIHHVAKNQGEVTADSARGGGALKDKTRGMRVLNPMTFEQADKAGLDSPDGYFRIDHGKVNLIASGQSQWRRFVSVPLMNGKGLFNKGDEIGVVEAWRWPSRDDLAEREAKARAAVVADVPAEVLAGLKVRLDNGFYKANVQASSWAGKLVAELLDIDLADKDEKLRVKAMLAAWLANGDLQIVTEKDAHRHDADVVKSGAAPEN